MRLYAECLAGWQKSMIDESELYQIRAELYAYYARLNGHVCDELRYTPYGVDPKEVHGGDFLGETFRVIREKKVKAYGEYRTRRLVLDAWDGMSQG